jgi:hypothetical protein
MFGPKGVRARGIVAFIATATVVLGLCAFQAPASSQALTGSDFSAGNIISDDLFYDSNAMTQASIQAFLNSHIGSCANGACLNVLVDDVASRSRLVSDSTGNVRCEAFQGGRLTAAEIIYRVQVACGISAKVILVTLQKEQGLVTQRAPSQAALDRAMGYACPDTAPCAPTSLGFGNQIYAGTLQLKTYKASRFGVQPGVRSILLNPSAACGATAVNIQNYATAALYNYTPYQPNAAALANLRGSGDGCSSYGNRNFWVYYNDWFGSTEGVPPVASKNTVVGEPSSYAIARDNTGALWLYPANGTGGWALPRGQIGSGWTGMTTIFDAGDFNGDGNSDVIAVDGVGSMWMYPRNGSGDWLPRVLIGTSWNSMTTIVGAGDFNGDGHPDVLARDISGAMWLYPGNGKGGWLPRTSAGDGWNQMSYIFGAGDFDGDGHADILALGSNGDLWLYPGDGKGWFSLPRTLVASGWGGMTAVFSAGDFNGDGHEDVMARDASGAMWLYPGDGKGGLLPRVQAGDGWNSMTSVFVVAGTGKAAPGSSTPPPVESAAVSGDFNGDGKADILARDAAGILWLYPSDGKGGLSSRIQVSANWGGMSSIVKAGDFNGDGKADILARDAAGVLWLYPGDGKGGLSPRIRAGDGWNSMTAIFGSGNFSGDGLQGVLSRDSSGAMWLYKGDGKGWWSLPRTQAGDGWNQMTSIFDAGDFNGDGNQDIFARDATGAMWLYKGDGRGWFLLPRTQAGDGWNQMTSLIGNIDFDGDGHPDVLARDASGILWLYRGDGNGGFILPRVEVASGMGAMTWMG